jgi:hypothetical protein
MGSTTSLSLVPWFKGLLARTFLRARSHSVAEILYIFLKVGMDWNFRFFEIHAATIDHRFAFFLLSSHLRRHLEGAWHRTGERRAAAVRRPRVVVEADGVSVRVSGFGFRGPLMFARLKRRERGRGRRSTGNGGDRAASRAGQDGQ